MAVFIKDREHAQQVWQALKDGKLDDDPERKQSADLAVRSFAAKLKRIREAPQEEHKDVKIDNAATRGLKAFGAGALGLVDLGVTLGTAAFAEPFAGWAGIIDLVRGEGLDNATHSVDAVRDFITVGPQSTGGREAFKSIAPAMMKLDNAMLDISQFVGRDNELASTAIYTALLGGLTLVGVKRIQTGALRVSAKMREMQKIADRLGLDVTSQGLTESIFEAAARMTPAEASLQAAPLRTALLRAHARKQKALDKLRESANADGAFLKARDVKSFAGGQFASLKRQGFDLTEMPVLQKQMRRLFQIDKKDPAFNRLRTKEGLVEAADVISLDNVQSVRNSMQQILEARAKVTNNTARVFRENKALQQTVNNIDEFLANGLHRDLIAGDAASIKRWQKFHRANSKFNNQFNVDRTIRQLMDLEASPATLNQWLLGATAVGAKKQASMTMQRITKILGKDHPAVEGIRQEFLYMVAEPLIAAEPNLRMFIRNYDKIVRRNGDLVRSMGLRTSEMEPLLAAAKVAVSLPPKGLIKHMLGNWETAFARYFVGHSIAKAGVRVSLGRTALHVLFGRDQIKQKKLMALLAEAQFGGPVIVRNGGAASRVIQAAFVADLEGVQDKRKRDEAAEKRQVVSREEQLRIARANRAALGF